MEEQEQLNQEVVVTEEDTSQVINDIVNIFEDKVKDLSNEELENVNYVANHLREVIEQTGVGVFMLAMHVVMNKSGEDG